MVARAFALLRALLLEELLAEGLLAELLALRPVRCSCGRAFRFAAPARATALGDLPAALRDFGRTDIVDGFRFDSRGTSRRSAVRILMQIKNEGPPLPDILGE